jgi:hypothetical protein
VATLTTEACQSLKNIEPITDTEKLKVMREYMNRTDAGQDIKACASCGISSINNESIQSDPFISDTLLFGGSAPIATVFEMTEEESIKYKPDCTNPNSYAYKVRTCTIINGKYYYLHHDLLVGLSRDNSCGDDTNFGEIAENQWFRDILQFEIFEDKLYQIRRDPYDFLKEMGSDYLILSRAQATKGNVAEFINKGERSMWESGNTPAKKMADKANNYRDMWLLSQPKGVYFVGSDHIKALESLYQQ